MDLLASILMMIALYSINLRVMGGQRATDQRPTLFTLSAAREHPRLRGAPLVLLVMVVLPPGADWFFATERGLAIRATGSNARMARAQGVKHRGHDAVGMAMSNVLVARLARCSCRTRAGPISRWALAPSSSAWRP